MKNNFRSQISGRMKTIHFSKLILMPPRILSRLQQVSGCYAIVKIKVILKSKTQEYFTSVLEKSSAKKYEEDMPLRLTGYRTWRVISNPPVKLPHFVDAGGQSTICPESDCLLMTDSIPSPNFPH